MSSCVELELSEGVVVEAGHEDILGRSSLARVHFSDPRISTIHAELSCRSDGLILIARGGRILVNGRAYREICLQEGMEVVLAPGQSVKVRKLWTRSKGVVAPTAGREQLLFEVGSETVIISSAQARLVLGRTAGRILGELLKHSRQMVWHELAELIWPEEATLRRAWRNSQVAGWTEIDERRLRNRWDQQAVALRRQLEPFRQGGLLIVERGLVQLLLGEQDQIIPLVEPAVNP